MDSYGVSQTQPATFPISYSQAKLQCHIDSDYERDWLNLAMASATTYAESYMRISLITRTVTVIHYPSANSIVEFKSPNQLLILPFGPVQSITSVTDGAGNAIAAYEQRHNGTVDYIRLWQGAMAPITIVYQAGYGATAASVPADIRGNILAHIGHKHFNREAGKDATPSGLAYVYDKYRANSLAG